VVHARPGLECRADDTPTVGHKEVILKPNHKPPILPDPYNQRPAGRPSFPSLLRHLVTIGAAKIPKIPRFLIVLAAKRVA